MNWKIPAGLLIVGLLTLEFPNAAAAPNAQTGTLSASYWTSCGYAPSTNCPTTATVAVQPGTTFTLDGSGDFDIYFYNAAGTLVGASLACGSEAGTVPATAVVGVVGLYGSTPVGILPGPLPCFFSGPATVVAPAAFAYVDGIGA